MVEVEIDPDNLYKKPLYHLRHIAKFHCPISLCLNAYMGCSHNCWYCFARHFQENRHIWRPVRPADPEVLADELKAAFDGRRNSIMHKMIRHRVPIWLGSMTDCFQPIERKFGVTYRMLEILAEYQYPTLIVTKGEVINDQKYLDIIKTFHTIVHMSFSTWDDILAAQLEPNAPSPSRKFQFLRNMNDQGINGNIRFSPILPMLSEDAEPLIDKAADAGVKVIIGFWLEMIRDKKFAGYMNKALGFDYIAKLEEAHYPIDKRGGGNYPTAAHIHQNAVRLGRYAKERGIDISILPDPLFQRVGNGRSCCMLDKFPGFEGFVDGALRANANKIYWHTSKEQYLDGLFMPFQANYLRDSFNLNWDTGRFADDGLSFHPEDSTYSRRPIVEAVESGLIEPPKLVGGKWVITPAKPA